MAEQKTVTLALTNPKEVSYANGEKTLWRFASMDGEEYACFDAELVKTFRDQELAGKPTQYLIRLNDDPNKSPSLQSIPGVYEGRKGGGGWRGGGGGMTNRQAALLAAAKVAMGDADPEKAAAGVLLIAERFAAWLGVNAEPAGRSDSPVPANGNGATPGPAKPEPKPTPESAYLMEHASEVWPGRPGLADSFLRSAAKRVGKDSVHELTPDQIIAVHDELKRIQEAQKEGKTT